MSKPVKVMIAVPNEGHTQVEAYANRLEQFFHMGKLQQRTGQFEFHFVTLGRILTPLAREEAANLAMETNMDYLYMIDDDMICPVDLFEKLYAHNVDIVAPLAFTRNFPHHPVMYDVVDGWDAKTKSSYFINHFVSDYQKDALVQCDAVGFGAVLIKRWVLEKMEKPRFMSTCGSGEDMFFCHQAGKVGAKVFMDTATKLGHLSHPIEVTEDYVERVRRQNNFREPISLSNKHKNGAKEISKNEALLILGD